MEQDDRPSSNLSGPGHRIPRRATPPPQRRMSAARRRPTSLATTADQPRIDSNTKRLAPAARRLLVENVDGHSFVLALWPLGVSVGVIVHFDPGDVALTVHVERKLGPYLGRVVGPEQLGGFGDDLRRDLGGPSRGRLGGGACD